MFKYTHTNLVAENPERLIHFYKTVLQCRSIGKTRDMRGQWVDDMTGIPNAHITGEHLLLPGYGPDLPTLEIFSYDEVLPSLPPQVNRKGMGHLAFQVDDVEKTLNDVIAAGGQSYGKLVHVEFPDHSRAIIAYAADPEGNLLELQGK